MHLKTDHTEEFKQHEPYNKWLLQQCIPSNPCDLCGLHFKQYHQCHLIRQLALLLVKETFPLPPMPESALQCDFCGKVCATKHGLQRHVQVYHAAEQACSEMDPALFDAHCHIFEAVLHDRCEDLLGDESIQFFLATQRASVAAKPLHGRMNSNVISDKTTLRNGMNVNVEQCAWTISSKLNTVACAFLLRTRSMFTLCTISTPS